MIASCLKIIIITIIYCETVTADLILGQRCRQKDNTLGICLKINDCKPVMDIIRSGQIRSNPPTVCSQTARTVCCPVAVPTTITSTSSTTTNHPMRISEKKCREYARATVQKIFVQSLLIGEQQNEVIIDKCKHKSVPLIVGGTEADLYEFPHQALLGYNDGDPGEWGCGGSLISPKFVLTAAHCLYPRSYGAVKFVKLGMHSRAQNDDKVFIYGVQEIFQHPTYSTKTFNDDIGLLRLNATVTINELIFPICMPTMLHENYNAIASGFGRTGYGESSSEILLKVGLEKFEYEECQEAFGKSIRVRNDTMLCYGHHSENKDSCSGDSGGPLQIRNDKKVPCTYTQIGVVSFGLKMCGTIGKPGVYANVFHYLDWIENIVWQDEE
ncbi:unnamed protein product [Chironomus riparius]|uniref:Peptidase S1 domain-containing protein n=1 Tax=Chironomus riparius TaxID=315576 RepID=A0A9N9RJC9_9DIPT|nr:unnamed protein product [Chironomus riparius]